MINIPNYREFYQKSLIPMNEHDKQVFCKEFCRDCDHCIKANHWLVAVEGSPMEADHNKYQWNVVVYPAKETGIFWSLKVPYYTSPSVQSFDEAVVESKVIVEKIVNSQYTAQTMMVS